MDIADKRIRIEAPPFPLLKAVYSTAIVRVSHLALMLWQGVWLGFAKSGQRVLLLGRARKRGRRQLTE